MAQEKVINCFEPVIDANSKILILGSIPSKKSRDNGFYYYNPTNRFWKIMSAVYKEDFVGADINAKKTLLLKHGVGLSDVYFSCEMKKDGSSLDSNITKRDFNDIPSLIGGTAVKKIYVTSKKAYKDFIKRFGEYIYKQGVDIISLPSPSSANRSVYKTDDELITAWKKAIKPV